LLLSITGTVVPVVVMVDEESRVVVIGIVVVGC
jgi:hypothetical protein